MKAGIGGKEKKKQKTKIEERSALKMLAGKKRPSLLVFCTKSLWATRLQLEPARKSQTRGSSGKKRSN